MIRHVSCDVEVLYLPLHPIPLGTANPFFGPTFAAVFEHLLVDISTDTYTLAHPRERSEVLRLAVHVSSHLVVYFSFSSINYVVFFNS